MIFSNLYSNQPQIFPPIRFRRGLNVIQATVYEPQDSTKDSHCLGKSLLIELLDYCLLLEARKDFFLKQHAERFADFVFFLEVIVPSGCITIRRSVSESSKASFRRHSEPNADFADLPQEQWDHWQLPQERAVEWLDGALDLAMVKPFSFRKGHSYLLRSQSDFGDVFRLAKFRGKDRDWKPYLAHVLGLNAELLVKKYDLDAAISAKDAEHADAKKNATFSEDDVDRLKGQIEVKQDDVDSKQRRIDDFDFHEKEIELATQLVEEVEQRTTELNNEIYNLKFDIDQATAGMQTELHFDIAEVDAVFRDAQLYFPTQLKRDYEQLIEFNRQIMTERRLHLEERVGELRTRLAVAEQEHLTVATRRVELLSVLRQRDSLKKYKQLQGTIDGDRAELALMKEKFSRIEAMIELRKKIDQLKDDRNLVVGQIRNVANAASDRYRAIRLRFAKLVRDVLDAPAELFIRVNDEGNLEFHADFQNLNAADSFTSEARGTTYKKFLCMAFDLAVLITCAKEPFFHFVYHDGALETEDRRRKLRWLAAVRQACEEFGIQYIMTLIDDDLPRDDRDQKIPFAKDEIIRELHDRGDDGRLFRMPKF
ncbi:MAG: DUF2326 domain-containing protein [Pirellulaceae bacterium]|nr:DUF2326 domain-containing protein [Pirellulaceae bacterium]